MNTSMEAIRGKNDLIKERSLGYLRLIVGLKNIGTNTMKNNYSET